MSINVNCTKFDSTTLTDLESNGYKYPPEIDHFEISPPPSPRMEGAFDRSIGDEVVYTPEVLSNASLGACALKMLRGAPSVTEQQEGSERSSPAISSGTSESSEPSYVPCKIPADLYVDLFEKNRQSEELRVACVRGDILTIRDRILENPALANRTFTLGERPLHEAARMESWKAIQILFYFGADPRIPNSCGKTPAEIARGNENMVSANLLDKKTQQLTSNGIPLPEGFRYVYEIM